MTIVPSGPSPVPAYPPSCLPHSSRTRAEVAAAIKDDLRTPVHALQQLTRTLEDGALSDELEARVRGHAKLLARSVALLIEDLVFVHTADHRAVPLAREQLPLRGQLERTVALFPDRVIRVADQLPAVQVHADPLRLQQLLANLFRGTVGVTRPLRVDAAYDDRTVTLRVHGCGPMAGHELDLARALSQAHGGRLRHWPAGDGTVDVELPRAVQSLRLRPRERRAR